jgi:DNA replication protein DnaC
MLIGGKEVSDEYANIRMTKWGIPPRYRRAELPEDWLRPLALESYFIHGSIGSGKTWLACAMLKANTRATSAVFITAGGMLESIKESFNTGTQYDEDGEPIPTQIDRFRKCGLLVLDDLGRLYSTDWARASVYDIINYRYSWLLPMYITSNLSLKELATVLDDLATVSRISHMCEVITLPSGNKRHG